MSTHEQLVAILSAGGVGSNVLYQIVQIAALDKKTEVIFYAAFKPEHQ